MKKEQATAAPRDEYLEAAKREYQERSREFARNGARTQESMFFIAPSIVKTFKDSP